MRKLEKKLIISILSLLLVMITLTSTTFAWFARNSEAWIDSVEINIQNQDGLLISIDGVNFKTSLDKTDVKKAIISKKLSPSLTDDERDWILNERLEEQYKDILLKPITTKDLASFYEINPTFNKDEGEFYSLMEVSDNKCYVEFDVYFKIATTPQADKTEQVLCFQRDSSSQKASYITSDEDNVCLINSLSTQDKLYKAGEYINVSAKDAARVGVKTDTSNLIFEPNMGLGSYALENGEGIHNPHYNAMLTYFNNTHLGKLQPLQTDLDVYKNTYKSFDENVVLGTFSPTEDKTEYTTSKITVYIWLEGYDSDYFAGISVDKLTAYLSFTYREA